MENKIKNNNLVECCRVATLRSRLSFGLTLAYGVWDDRIILKNGIKKNGKGKGKKNISLLQHSEISRFETKISHFSFCCFASI